MVTVAARIAVGYRVDTVLMASRSPYGLLRPSSDSLRGGGGANHSNVIFAREAEISNDLPIYCGPGDPLKPRVNSEIRISRPGRG